jgi:hypothetical protein
MNNPVIHRAPKIFAASPFSLVHECDSPFSSTTLRMENLILTLPAIARDNPQAITQLKATDKAS